MKPVSINTRKRWRSAAWTMRWIIEYRSSGCGSCCTQLSFGPGCPFG
jgi:hypothetical protein